MVCKLASRGYISSGGGLNPFAGSAVEEMIRSGSLEEHLQELRSELSQRCEALVQALNESLPKDAPKAINPWGGHFIWLRLPDHCDASLVQLEAKKHKLGLLPGTTFSVNATADHLRSFVRLSFAFYDVETLSLAGKALGTLIKEMRC